MNTPNYPNKKFNWPLCADVFTFWDKVKIFKFLLTERIWTYGNYITAFEKRCADYFGVKNIIMTSSGSTANELIALRRKWELQQAGEWPKKNKVIVPVNTWISSITPFIHAGYEPIFVDVNPLNLNVTSDILEETLKKNENIGTVFYTALLGFFGDIRKCKEIAEKYRARFLMDNCEATLSEVAHEDYDRPRQSLMSFVTCSTSLFYSHFIVSGTEGGLIATNSDEEADWFRMMRSHGLTRNMPDKYKNPNVHPDFDFALLGSNYRSSNLQAFMAGLDFDRAIDFSINKRRDIFYSFYDYLDCSSYVGKYRVFCSPFTNDYNLYIPLAIPILCKSREQRIKVEAYLNTIGVQTRPLIAGCLCSHTAFKNFCKPEDYPVSTYSQECGLYIGLNKNVTPKMAKELALALNQL